MTPKRAKYFTYGNDKRCHEIRKFIEDAGVLLDVWDIGEKPLSEYELDSLLQHFDMGHFLNQASTSYKKHSLDQELPERDEVIKLIAEDHTLLRRPIIRTIRLTTVGTDKKKIAQMLQIPQDGNSGVDEAKSSKQSRTHVYVTTSK